jgi:two-component system sensor histidine kinase VicK
MEGFEKKDLPDRFPEYLLNVRISKDQGLSLIDELMEMKEMDSGAELEKDVADLVPFVDTVYRMFQPQAEKKDIRLEFDVTPGTMLCRINARKITRVFQNLVSNALKFTPRGGRIILSLLSAGGQIEFSVEDSGIGIPRDRQKDIFRRFTSFQRAGTEGEKATGLGLFIAREITEKHGGTLTVRSSEGGGSRFIVLLPAVAADAE